MKKKREKKRARRLVGGRPYIGTLAFSAAGGESLQGGRIRQPRLPGEASLRRIIVPFGWQVLVKRSGTVNEKLFVLPVPGLCICKQRQL